MPYPVQNQSFEKGRLDGFRHAGSCKVVRSFATARGRTIRPIHGRYLACIDDPRAVDEDGERTPAAAARAADVSMYLYDDLLGNRTYGIDGAWIECDVTLKRGEKLAFQWAFARFDDAPYNDFAYFAVYEGGDTGAPPTYGSRLSDVIWLEETNRDLSGWNTQAFAPERAFTGVLRWACCNGVQGSQNRRPPPAPPQRALPSALLLDSLEIIR